MRSLIFAYLIAIGLYALASPMIAKAMLEPGLQDILEAADAWCETDSECMRHCPPPADDPDCDGGPQ
jgi:hypothetical protein